MNWITIQNVHLNLDNIMSFTWQMGTLYVFDISDEPFTFHDVNKEYYRKLCDACCMNMVEE